MDNIIILPTRKEVLKMSPNTKKLHTQMIRRLACRRHYEKTKRKQTYAQLKETQRKYEQSEKGKEALKRKNLKRKLKRDSEKE